MKSLLYFSSFLLLFTSCTSDFVVPENPTDKIVTKNASGKREAYQTVDQAACVICVEAVFDGLDPICDVPYNDFIQLEFNQGLTLTIDPSDTPFTLCADITSLPPVRFLRHQGRGATITYTNSDINPTPVVVSFDASCVTQTKRIAFFDCGVSVIE